LFFKKSSHIHYHVYISDKNVPGADNVMKMMRSLVEFFSKSTQKMTELKQVQAQSQIRIYHNKKPVGTLQDVITRWWSTHRSLLRLRYLKPALETMVISELIDKSMMPTDEQWAIMEQIEISLACMAKFQRMLEGQHYVTASLVIIAVLKIRESYNKVLCDENTTAPVKALTKKLLEDFNQRFHPANDGKKVKYTGKADIGFRNRYTGVHPYFFLASLFDPRVKGMLPNLMDADDLKQLKHDALLFMLEQKKMEE
jgi:hypothetical protein